MQVSDYKYSYSRLDLFDQCQYKYKLKYINDNHSNESTLALELGTLGHLGKEKWAEYLIEGEEPDYNYIRQIIEDGLDMTEIIIVNGNEAQNNKKVAGQNELKIKYFEQYIEVCNKSGMTYDQKLEVYLNNLEKETMEDGWSVLAVEKDFTFIFANKYTIRGFIDRIDINENGDLRVIDYKTSKAVYGSRKLATPLQMFIYALACEKMYGKRPIEFVYDFIFLGEKQNACSKGYHERGMKKLEKMFIDLEICYQTDTYIPKPTPLCYWCDFCNNTPLADKKLKHLCNYYSMWTPENKNYAVNEKFDVNKNNKISKMFDF